MAPEQNYLLSEAGKLLVAACECEDNGQIAQAVRLYRRAALLGDTAAQSNLATLLDDKVKPARPKEAVYWYKRAVKGGDYLGAWNLAMHYRNLGKPRWQLHWLHVAARMGEPDAAKEARRLERQLERHSSKR